MGVDSGQVFSSLLPKVVLTGDAESVNGLQGVTVTAFRWTDLLKKGATTQPTATPIPSSGLGFHLP